MLPRANIENWKVPCVSLLTSLLIHKSLITSGRTRQRLPAEFNSLLFLSLVRRLLRFLRQQGHLSLGKLL